MPFSGPQGQQFDDFEDCVSSMEDEDGVSDAEGLCAVWMRQAKKLSDEYDPEHLVEVKQQLGLSDMEFLTALKLLEEESQHSEKAEIPDYLLDEREASFFVPDDGAAERAQQALDWREEHPDEIAGGSDEDGEGWRRAQQLVDYNSNEEPLAVEYWEEIDAFHSRHHAQGNHQLSDEYEGEPWKDAGYVSHLTWGGDPAYEQAKRITELEEEEDGGDTE